MGVGLYILSLVLSSVLFIVGLFFALVVGFIQVRWRTGLKKADAKFLKLAKSVDKFGNVICEELFNATLIKNSNHKFGNIEQTISMVLGYNQLAGSLTRTGRMLVWILEKIEKDHCLKAIHD